MHPPIDVMRMKARLPTTRNSKAQALCESIPVSGGKETSPILQLARLAIPVLACVGVILIQGCKNPDAGTITQLPELKISSYQIDRMTNGGRIRVSGTGATSNSQVVLSLNYTVAAVGTESELGSVVADGLGLFSFTNFQKCALPPKASKVSAYLNARDAATGREANTPSLDASFLICPE